MKYNGIVFALILYIATLNIQLEDTLLVESQLEDPFEVEDLFEVAMESQLEDLIEVENLLEVESQLEDSLMVGKKAQRGKCIHCV